VLCRKKEVLFTAVFGACLRNGSPFILGNGFVNAGSSKHHGKNHTMLCKLSKNLYGLHRQNKMSYLLIFARKAKQQFFKFAVFGKGTRRFNVGSINFNQPGFMPGEEFL